MRHVVDTDYVAHLWAHQSQSHARNPQGNFYFDGKTIYSYGSHFICGMISENQNGQSAYLVNSNNYSSTTSKHMGLVRWSIPGDTIRFDTTRFVTLRNGKFFPGGYMEALRFIIDEIKDINGFIEKQRRARKYDYRNDIRTSLRNIRRWIEFWGLDRRQMSTERRWLPPALTILSSSKWADKDKYWRESNLKLFDLLAKVIDLNLIAESDNVDSINELIAFWTDDAAMVARLDSIHKSMKNAEAKRQREMMKEFIRRKQEWITGKISNYYLNFPGHLAYNATLRVKENIIETSMGIQVDVKEAKRLWKLVDKFHKNEGTFKHDIVVDALNQKWTLNSYKDDILTAGCHRLHYNDMRDTIINLGIAV